MSLSIRLATVANIADLMEMRRDLYRLEPESLNNDRDRKALETLVGNSSVGRAWLAESDSGFFGFAILTFCYSIEFGGTFALIDELYLSPASRGQGIGTAMLRQIEAAMRAEDIRAIRLEVDRTNVGAERLYRRLGFETHNRNLMTKWLHRG